MVEDAALTRAAKVLLDAQGELMDMVAVPSLPRECIALLRLDSKELRIIAKEGHDDG